LPIAARAPVLHTLLDLVGCRVKHGARPRECCGTRWRLVATGTVSISS
jgi:hypothetical protein